MFDVVPFHESHTADLDLCAEDRRWLSNDFPLLTWRDRVKFQAMSGPSYSVIRDGVVLACGGICMHYPGVGELWLVTDSEARSAAFRLVRAIIRNMDAVARQWDFVRVQVAIPEGGMDFSRRLVERMGFTRETKDEGMRKMARDGSTCHLYARIY